MATPAVRHPVGDPPARWITIRKPRAEVLNGGKAGGHTTDRLSAIGGRSCVSKYRCARWSRMPRDANHTMTQSRGHR